MRKYFYLNDKEKNGPFSFEELKNENITPNTLIWFEGLEDWTSAIEIYELENILILFPPPVISDEKDELNKTLFEEVEPSIIKKRKDNSLSKNYPYMLLISFIAGIIVNRDNLSLNEVGEFIGIVIASFLFYTGVPLLIVRIVKWLSANKHWNKQATKSAWIIQLIITFMSVFGSFV